MVSQTTNSPKEAHQMHSTKIRTIIVTLIAACSFAGAAIGPTAASAQWHNYCVAGHCTTHTNYASNGSRLASGSPCPGLNANYDNAYKGLLDAREAAKTIYVSRTREAEKQAEVAEAEAQVHLAELADFEWGCSPA
jgi:hypothetical protein